MAPGFYRSVQYLSPFTRLLLINSSANSSTQWFQASFCNFLFLLLSLLYYYFAMTVKIQAKIAALTKFLSFFNYFHTALLSRILYILLHILLCIRIQSPSKAWNSLMSHPLPLTEVPNELPNTRTSQTLLSSLSLRQFSGWLLSHCHKLLPVRFFQFWKHALIGLIF